jgi:hypothetical protein
MTSRTVEHIAPTTNIQLICERVNGHSKSEVRDSHKHSVHRTTRTTSPVGRKMPYVCHVLTGYSRSSDALDILTRFIIWSPDKRRSKRTEKLWWLISVTRLSYTSRFPLHLQPIVLPLCRRFIKWLSQTFPFKIIIQPIVKESRQIFGMHTHLSLGV